MENRKLGDDETNSKSEDDPEEERNVEELDPMKCLISFLKDRGNARVEVSCYDGSFNVETLIESIEEFERYFEFENVQDPNWVRFAMKKLKGHLALWWDMLQKDRVDN
jgi:hypothetical protein